MTCISEPKRATVVGTGLIGGSIGLALKDQGWTVSGSDRDPARAERALEIGAIDGVGIDPLSRLAFVATPVSAGPAAARWLLSQLPDDAVVTDVGGVKAPIVAEVDHPRFVGGHPMAGSEQEGVDGADPQLFVGATWVLTPTAATDPGAYLRVRSVVSSLGADVVAVTPESHDDLVALVSHVPHLAAATLMTLAAEGAEEHAALLRLAAGGFRDMTRVAAGHPGIWPEICADNAGAIVGSLDRLVASLQRVRDAVANRDRDALLELLQKARKARINLPAQLKRPEDMVEIRIPVPDQAGVFAEVTTLVGQLGVNIEDIEIAHSVEGDRGVLSLVIDAERADLATGALQRRGYRPSVWKLG